MQDFRELVRRVLVTAVLALLALGCTPDGPGASGGPAASGAASPASSPADGGNGY